MFNSIVIHVKRVRLGDRIKIAGKKYEVMSISTYESNELEFGFIDEKTNTILALRVDDNVAIKIYR